MNCQEKEGDPEYPMRFLTKCQGSGVFDGLTKTAGVWVNSEVVVGKWWEGVGDGSSEMCAGDVFFSSWTSCWVQNVVMRQGIGIA